MDIYKKLLLEIKNLKKTTPNFAIGKSVLGKNITCFKLGNDCGKKIIVQGCIHAREYITAFLLLKVIRYLKNFYFNGQIYIVPLSNPDGVDICINGSKNIKNKKRKKLISGLLKINKKSIYKANANGVDLNTNFDAMWGSGKQNNLLYPDTQNFVGFKPNSESEVKAIINLTNMVNPLLTISYHSKGEVVYYGYNGQSKRTAQLQQKYLQEIVDITKYKPIFTKNSAGGYKDYCLLKKDIVGFTIEVGNDKLSHPISLKNLDQIFLKNKDLILALLKG